MTKQALFLLACIVVTVPAWSQVQPAAVGDIAPADEDSRMMAPPLATGFLYANVAGVEERSNYMTASVAATTAYISNILPDTTNTPVADSTISIGPALTFDRTRPRQHATFTYDPSFTFYRNTSALNALDQSATGTYEGRLSPHIAVGLQDTFLRTSNVFNTQYPFVAGGLAGTAQTPIPAVIVPFAEQIRNNANISMTYQFSSKGMVGGGGRFANFIFPDHSRAPGLYDSKEGGGSAFYNRRLSRIQYAGVMYEYKSIITSLSTKSEQTTQVHTVLPFYMLSFDRKFTLSASVGAQHIAILEKPLPLYTSWAPAAAVSFGWQGSRGVLAASYLGTVISGEGLAGVFNSHNMAVSGGWTLARTWTGRTLFSYSTTSSVTSLIALNYPGNRLIAATALLEHTIGQRFSMECGYDHLNQQYSGLAVISANPDSDHAYVTISYKLTKSLGR